eukprot:2108793-Pyramimonas_sp.AAC.1
MKSVRYLPKRQVPIKPKQSEITTTSSAVCHLAGPSTPPQGVVASGVTGQEAPMSQLPQLSVQGSRVVNS